MSNPYAVAGESNKGRRRIVVGISGASGVLMGYRLLQELRRHPEVETHLIMSKGAELTFRLETDVEPDEVREAADRCYDEFDLAAAISSGSYETDGMIVMPCSMKSLSAIANAYDENLLVRAADVCLKEGRRVVLVPREMPMGMSHLRNMVTARENGCTIVPPMLTFYNSANTLEEQVSHVIGKVLRQFGLKTSSFRPWEGVKNEL